MFSLWAPLKLVKPPKFTSASIAFWLKYIHFYNCAPPNTHTCIPLAIDDSQASQLLAAASGSEEEGWGREGERERILKGLAAISGLAEAYQFREPVPLDVVQDYCRVIAFPTDLSTITKRLQSGFYRSVESITFLGSELCFLFEYEIKPQFHLFEGNFKFAYQLM